MGKIFYFYFWLNLDVANHWNADTCVYKLQAHIICNCEYTNTYNLLVLILLHKRRLVEGFLGNQVSLVFQ